MKKDQQQQARDLYFKTDLSKTEIADMVGISRPTLDNWIREFNWDNIKQSAQCMPIVLAENCYHVMLRIQESILSRDNSEKPVTPQEVNMLYKITNTISKLKTRGTLNETLEMQAHFIDFVDTTNPGLIDTIQPVVDAYILSRAKAQSAHLTPARFPNEKAAVAQPAPSPVSKEATKSAKIAESLQETCTFEEAQQARAQLHNTIDEYPKDTPYTNPQPQTAQPVKSQTEFKKTANALKSQGINRTRRRKIAHSKVAAMN